MEARAALPVAAQTGRAASSAPWRWRHTSGAAARQGVTAGGGRWRVLGGTLPSWRRKSAFAFPIRQPVRAEA